MDFPFYKNNNRFKKLKLKKEKVAQLFHLRGLWRHRGLGTQTGSAAGVMALSESVFEPLVAGDQKASLVSLSS